MFQAVRIGVFFCVALSLSAAGCYTEECQEGFDTGWEAGFDAACACDDSLSPGFERDDPEGPVESRAWAEEYMRCLASGFNNGWDNGWEVCCD